MNWIVELGRTADEVERRLRPGNIRYPCARFARSPIRPLIIVSEPAMPQSAWTGPGNPSARLFSIPDNLSRICKSSLMGKG